MELFEKEIERNIVFDGRIFKTVVCKAELPNGEAVSRELTVHSGGVCILPIDNEGYGYFVKQYRYGAGKVLLEAPAGKLEIGEDPFDAAVRELSEETGFISGRVIPMGVLYSSPAIMTEKIYMYLALDLTCGRQHLDHDEFLELQRIKLRDARDMVYKNEIEDGKSQALILKSAHYLNL